MQGSTRNDETMGARMRMVNIVRGRWINVEHVEAVWRDTHNTMHVRLASGATKHVDTDRIKQLQDALKVKFGKNTDRHRTEHSRWTTLEPWSFTSAPCHSWMRRGTS
jgi:hypothetical protein